MKNNRIVLSVSLALVASSCSVAGVLAADGNACSGAAPVQTAAKTAQTSAQTAIQSEASEQPEELTQADLWVKHRTEPWAVQQAVERKSKKHPVRSFVKKVEKGAGQEMKATFADMAKDAAFVFSVQDIDPYDKSAPPIDKPAIVMEMNLVDGTTAYLHRFPDNSFAIEGGFADNTVIDPVKQGEFKVKWPNGTIGRLVKTGDEYKIYRPDDSITTIKKNPSGDWDINNDKIGFMGTAHPDETGLQYELGTW